MASAALMPLGWLRGGIKVVVNDPGAARDGPRCAVWLGSRPHRNSNGLAAERSAAEPMLSRAQKRPALRSSQADPLCSSAQAADQLSGPAAQSCPSAHWRLPPVRTPERKIRRSCAERAWSILTTARRSRARGRSARQWGKPAYDYRTSAATSRPGAAMSCAAAGLAHRIQALFPP
jgi:hypothetical protein